MKMFWADFFHPGWSEIETDQRVVFLPEGWGKTPSNRPSHSCRRLRQTFPPHPRTSSLQNWGKTFYAATDPSDMTEWGQHRASLALQHTKNLGETLQQHTWATWVNPSCVSLPEILRSAPTAENSPQEINYLLLITIRWTLQGPAIWACSHSQGVDTAILALHPATHPEAEGTLQRLDERHWASMHHIYPNTSVSIRDYRSNLTTQRTLPSEEEGLGSGSHTHNFQSLRLWWNQMLGIYS